MHDFVERKHNTYTKTTTNRAPSISFLLPVRVVTIWLSSTLSFCLLRSVQVICFLIHIFVKSTVDAAITKPYNKRLYTVHNIQVNNRWISSSITHTILKKKKNRSRKNLAPKATFHDISKSACIYIFWNVLNVYVVVAFCECLDRFSIWWFLFVFFSFFYSPRAIVTRLIAATLLTPGPCAQFLMIVGFCFTYGRKFVCEFSSGSSIDIVYMFGTLRMLCAGMS